MAFITFITTCRGRLAHLRETLPSLAAQSDAAVIVVDYGCPDKSGAWVEANFTDVEVVRSDESTRFELARARNLGAQRAQSPWMCFIDADTRVDVGFSERLKPLLQAGRFYQADPRNIETWGTSICAKADFDCVGGYDEVIQGWGKEDDDFYARLLLAGVRYGTFPGDMLHGIRHAEAERVAHYAVKDRRRGESSNYVYGRAKIDLMLLRHTPLSLEARKELYTQVHAAVMSARESGKPMTIAVPYVTEYTRACGPLEGRLVYALPNPRGDGAPSATIGSLIPRPLQRRRETTSGQ
jgi:glycosyltransferase involved in cell wall biosynthesis